jgi:hypothetical protein
MMTFDFVNLLTRVRAEFREMPGLRLTLPQAARLWQVEPAVCGEVLQTLVAERFLLRTRSGSFTRTDHP